MIRNLSGDEEYRKRTENTFRSRLEQTRRLPNEALLDPANQKPGAPRSVAVHCVIPSFLLPYFYLIERLPYWLR
jgi:hypothetical protein